MSWVHGLCGCCSKPGVACMSCICPCVVLGNTAKDMDMEFCTFCFCGSAITMRAQVRSRFGIPGSCCGDVLAGCCCCCCSVAQSANQASEGKKLLDGAPAQMGMITVVTSDIPT
eukprot:Platyproteum_vivax@DN2436_c0_g1_i1.p1